MRHGARRMKHEMRHRPDEFWGFARRIENRRAPRARAIRERVGGLLEKRPPGRDQAFLSALTALVNAPTKADLMPIGSPITIAVATVATNAASRPYSIRSSPDSSRRNRIIDVLMCTPPMQCDTTVSHRTLRRLARPRTP